MTLKNFKWLHVMQEKLVHKTCSQVIDTNLFSRDHKVRMLLFTFFLTTPYLHLNTAHTNLIAEYFLTSKKRHQKLSHHTNYTVDSGQKLLPKNYAAVYRQYHSFSK